MLPPPEIRDWASKLIASELGTDSAAAHTEPATLRVYERLRSQLSAPVGADAFQALASRALAITKSQFPSHNALSLTAKGGLCGLVKTEPPLTSDESGEVGTILIAQMLRLILSLLGEAATVRLIERVPCEIEVQTKLGATRANILPIGTSFLGPFEDISLEADELRHVSERLESLADTHDDIDELMGVAGNIRNIATALDVFTLIRNKGGASQDSVLIPPTNGYLN